MIPNSHLWSRIEAHNFEPDQPFNFVQRLGRDHGWTLKEVRSAVEEYKRFCFLAVVSPTPVTPSEAVDEVWHQHLIYSRDYWDLWCGTVLQTTLHHDPTPGGPEAQRRYHRQYAGTLALYERYFGQQDEAWWPGTRARFGPAPRYRTVDTQQRYMFPKLWPFLHRIFGTEVVMPLNPLDWTAEPFLTLYVALALIALGLCLRLRSRIGGQSVPPISLTAPQLAYMAGGAGRAGDAILVELFKAKQATLSEDGKYINVDPRAALLRARPDQSGFIEPKPMTRLQFQSMLAPYLEGFKGS